MKGSKRAPKNSVVTIKGPKGLLFWEEGLFSDFLICKRSNRNLLSHRNEEPRPIFVPEKVPFGQ